MGEFRFLDHTADVGIQATGADLKEAFGYAAQGMFAWMVDPEEVEEREERPVEVCVHRKGANRSFSPGHSRRPCPVLGGGAADASA